MKKIKAKTGIPEYTSSWLLCFSYIANAKLYISRLFLSTDMYLHIKKNSKICSCNNLIADTLFLSTDRFCQFCDTKYMSVVYFLVDVLIKMSKICSYPDMIESLFLSTDQFCQFFDTKYVSCLFLSMYLHIKKNVKIFSYPWPDSRHIVSFDRQIS